MSDPKLVSIIGDGNVAYHFISRLANSIFNIQKVYIKEDHSADKIYSDFKNIKVFKSTKTISEDDIIIVATNDDAIRELELDLNNAFVYHTSGSVSIDALKGKTKNYGSIYPLQSLKKEQYKDHSISIPIICTASNELSSSLAKKIAKVMSDNIIEMDDEKKKHLHVAAVFANNFANQMWTVSEAILSKENIPFDILFPLIQKTANQLEFLKPADVQTGPAKRNDLDIISRQIELLKDETEFQELYKLITKMIQSS